MWTPRPKRLTPRWLVNKAKETKELRLFIDSQRFQDNIHGAVYLNHMERDLVDTPEFQRLFRVSQLGFVDLTFPTANHTRGAHSIATCAVAKQLVDIINANTSRVTDEKTRYLGQHETPACVSYSSAVLISAGALLHDISHGPFSHDIERKTHILDPEAPEDTKVRSFYGKYPKHDNYAENAILYMTIMDPKVSMLARVLRAYSPVFWKLMQLEKEGQNPAELIQFVETIENEWLANEPDGIDEILPSLIFHLLVHEKFDDALKSSTKSVAKSTNQDVEGWGLGPPQLHDALHDAWYQPYRHDIIGNTLSADLLDYLPRDSESFGIRRGFDSNLLDFYVLVPVEPSPTGADTASSDGDSQLNNSFSKRYRCAIDLNDYKRGTPRIVLVNDIFRLLDFRFEIHEKAVFHRVVQASMAMLSRTILLLDGKRIPLDELYGHGDPSDLKPSSAALCGEDIFLHRLVRQSGQPEHQSIPQKISERRVYRPLMVIPGDQIGNLLSGFQHDWHDAKARERTIRTLAAITDSEFYAPFFCFMSWCIENFLKHTFESLDEIHEYLTNVIMRDPQKVKDAMQLTPKRVIFWALPYKQLHKEPTIWVRVGGLKAHPEELCPLEKLTPNEDHNSETSDQWLSLRERVEAGIKEASTKYQSLWKSYVFMSDGLFYAGSLARFLEEHPCAQPGDDGPHKEHLKLAQSLSVAALRVAWKHYRFYRPNSLDKAACQPEQFSKMLTFVNEEDKTIDGDIAQQISAVAVDQYLHQEKAEPGLFAPPDNCRDVRYKFGRLAIETSTSEILQKRTELSETAHDWLQDVLTHLKEQTHKRWTEDEFEEIVDRLHVVPKLFPEISSTLLKAHARTLQPFLKTVWRRGPGWEEESKRLIPEQVVAEEETIRPKHDRQIPISELEPQYQLAAKGESESQTSRGTSIIEQSVDEPGYAPPNNIEELFWMRLQGQGTGKSGKRTRSQVFSSWARKNRLENWGRMSKFLDFLRTTLQEHRYRSNWVYTLDNLDQWFEEFNRGQPIGTNI